MKIPAVFLFLLVGCGGSESPLVGQWQVEAGAAKADPTDITGGMGNLMGGMKVFTFKADGTGSVRLGSSNEPFEWIVEGETLTRTATKTTAILKQRVLKAPFRIEGDKLIITEHGTEVVLKKR